MSQQSNSRPTNDVGRKLETDLQRQSAVYLTMVFLHLTFSILYVTASWLARPSVGLVTSIIAAKVIVSIVSRSKF